MDPVTVAVGLVALGASSLVGLWVLWRVVRSAMRLMMKLALLAGLFGLGCLLAGVAVAVGWGTL